MESKPKYYISEKNYEKFLNGVKLKIEEEKYMQYQLNKLNVDEQNINQSESRDRALNSVFAVYYNNKFIGSGIVENGFIKRDIILL